MYNHYISYRVLYATIGKGRKTKMWDWLDKIPYPILIVVAVLMLLAPFRPMPHVMEKLIMLKNGMLTRPIDIFDLFYHLIPTLLLGIRLYRSFGRE